MPFVCGQKPDKGDVGNDAVGRRIHHQRTRQRQHDDDQPRHDFTVPLRSTLRKVEPPTRWHLRDKIFSPPPEISDTSTAVAADDAAAAPPTNMTCVGRIINCHGLSLKHSDTFAATTTSGPTLRYLRILSVARHEAVLRGVDGQQGTTQFVAVYPQLNVEINPADSFSRINFVPPSQCGLRSSMATAPSNRV